MGFHEVRFPTNIDYGSIGGPGYSTNIVETDSGREERIARWASARRRYNGAYGIRSFDDLYEVTEFYLARQGPANGFRFKDWLDFTSAVNGRGAVTNLDQQIGVGDGTTTQFQLVKTYTSGPNSVSRNIEKPVSGSVVVAVDGVGTTSFSVNTTTGIVTFNSAPGNNLVVTAGFQFDVPVRFGAEVDLVLPSSIDSFDSGSIPDIPLIEVRGERPDPELGWDGGAKNFGSVSTNQTVSLLDGRALRFAPTTDIDVTLPDFASIATGGPHFLIINAGATDDITVKDDSGNTVVTIPAGEA
jgi:uncharacterized protein (TIGR02217 family)